MTIEELKSLGLSDEVLVSEYRRIFERDVAIPRGNDGEATAKRRDVYNALCVRWYA